MIGIAIAAAPWGPIHLAADDSALLALEVLATTASFSARAERRFGGPVEVVGRAAVGRAPWQAADRAVARQLAAAVEAVEAYLEGEPAALAALPIALRGLSDWDRLVLDGVRGIGWGQTIGYGQLARAIDRPGAARAVGGAVGRNPIGLVIPCHRVIAGDGTLGGYGGGWSGDREVLLAIKRSLLALEGVALPGRATGG